MNNLRYLFVVAAVALSALLFSCKKDDPDDTDTRVTADQSIAESEAGKVFEAIDRTLRRQSNKTGEDSDVNFLPDCAIVTLDTLSVPRKIVIDFGESGCRCDEWDYKVRKGKIIATYTGRYTDAGTIITWKTENYFVDNNEHRIDKVVENKGKNASGNTYFHITVSNAVITSNGTINWQAKRVREWSKGENTRITVLDDEYTITDIEPTTGTARNGTSYSVNITKPILWRVACPFKIVSGELVINITGKEKRTVNYGNGNCDKSFVVTIKNRSFVVSW